MHDLPLHLVSNKSFDALLRFLSIVQFALRCIFAFFSLPSRSLVSRLKCTSGQQRDAGEVESAQAVIVAGLGTLTLVDLRTTNTTRGVCSKDTCIYTI